MPRLSDVLAVVCHLDSIAREMSEPDQATAEAIALAATQEEDAPASEAVAQSIVCADCGKMMANEALAQYHAEKSGHTNFEESTEAIKPLTEEERKQKLEDCRCMLFCRKKSC